MTTESKHTPELQKPDFEELALHQYSGCKKDNHEHDCPCSAFEDGCEKIWNDYVIPIRAERDRLKEENDKLKAEPKYNPQFVKAFKQVQSINKELVEALEILYHQLLSHRFIGVAKVIRELLQKAKEI